MINVNELIAKLRETSDPEEQIKLADEILEIIPFEFGSLFTKAFAQMELGLIDEAIETFDTALYYKPNVDIELAYNGKGVCYAKKNEQCCQLGVEKFLPYTNFINMLYYY